MNNKKELRVYMNDKEVGTLAETKDYKEFMQDTGIMKHVELTMHWRRR